MATSAGDFIGQRGQNIASERLMEFCGNALPYFNPHVLGDKCPTFDLLVELVGPANDAHYFLAQVKATKKGYANGTVRLKVGVKGADIERMVRCPVPTYLIGVDEPAKAVYIVAIRGALKGRISSIPTRYPLDAANLRILWDEVKEYWEQFDSGEKKSAFAF